MSKKSLYAIIGGTIAVFSPFWALVFILSICGKFLLEEENYNLKFYIPFLIVFVIGIVLGISDSLHIGDSLIFIILITSTSLYVLKHKKNFLLSVLSGISINFIYSIFRFYFIWPKIFSEKSNHITEIISQVEGLVPKGQESEIFIKAITDSWEKFDTFQMAIFFFVMSIALYLGLFFLSKKIEIKWNFKKLILPHEIVYFLIASMVVYLIPNLRIIGLNLFIIVLSVFLLEGFAIINFYWGQLFSSSKILQAVLFFSFFLNPYLLVLIAIMGLFDIWFDFRKINKMEDLNEDHISG